MKKGFAILFMFLLFAQAIPVAHLFITEECSLFSLIDEEKPQESKSKETSSCKEFTFVTYEFTPQEISTGYHTPMNRTHLPSPFLEFFTPPPDQA